MSGVINGGQCAIVDSALNSIIILNCRVPFGAGLALRLYISDVGSLFRSYSVSAHQDGAITSRCLSSIRTSTMKRSAIQIRAFRTSGRTQAATASVIVATSSGTEISTPHLQQFVIELMTAVTDDDSLQQFRRGNAGCAAGWEEFT